MSRKRKQPQPESPDTDIEGLLAPDAPSDDSEPEQPKAPESAKAEAPKPETFVVAKGRSVTTRARGIVSSGQAVTAQDFAGGEARLQELATAGYLTGS